MPSSRAIPRDGGPVVFVADLATPQISEGDQHHLERVLRLRDGDALICSDGDGGWCHAAHRSGGVPERQGEVFVEPDPPYRLGVGFVVPKGNRAELVVQKLTEAGIDDIVPLHSERSVVKWDDAKAAKQQERLERVAREASSQSRRAAVPVVHGLSSLPEAAQTFGGSDSAGTMAVAEPGGGEIDTAVRWIMIGPEGGWAPGEVAALARSVALGTHVYRAETAAIAAGVLLTALRSGIVAPPGPRR